MDIIVFFGTIYEFYSTISAYFYLYLHYFQQKVSNFNKISGPQLIGGSSVYKINVVKCVVSLSPQKGCKHFCVHCSFEI